MPRPDGEVQMLQMQEVPRPVAPEPAPGNVAPGPQVGQQAHQLTAEEKLEVNCYEKLLRDRMLICLEYSCIFN